MPTIKIIRTEDDYKEALTLLEELMNRDPEPDSEDGEKLAILATLLQEYETKIMPESLPDPIDAIEFRMEQQGLKPVDLIPFIGSRSKVSEILSRKRPLTLSMIKALESGLGIPAKVLLNDSDDFRNPASVAWNRFPIKEMEKRGYFAEKLSKVSNLKKLMEDFFQPVDSPAALFGLLRKTNYRSARPMDKHALIVWSTRVVKKARALSCPAVYKKGSVNLHFMQEVARLSTADDGPIAACNFLKQHGILVIIEPDFPQTYLDGATIMLDKEHPIIGLTLRFDRLDNFWFTLMHELAHLSLHYDKGCSFFYDDLDNDDLQNEVEVSADRLAREALVPEGKWEVSAAKMIPSVLAAKSLAREIGVHPSIVAGKMRHEGGKYMYLNKIINENKIRKFFPEDAYS